MATAGLTPSLEVYSQKYEHIRLTRQNGILELQVHTRGDSLKWSAPAHDELGYCFGDIANDPENKVLIITGTGASFCAEADPASWGELTARAVAQMHQAGKRLLNNLLNIEIPVIGAVNGPALIHADLPLLSNIVIAAEEAAFQDCVHFTNDFVPGDGVHVVWPALLGPTRGSYFLLMGQVLDARQALQLGLVNEIVPRSEVMPRARVIAESIARRPAMVRHYSRIVLVQEMKRLMHDYLSHGLAVESLAMLDQTRET
jgi:enoyl-CoA hydratase/carnithine racemase